MWNQLNPDGAVKPGDRIVAVNGISGDAEALLKECEQLKFLEVTIQRARVLVDLQPCYAEPCPLDDRTLEGIAGSGVPTQTEEAMIARGGAGLSEADEAAGTAEIPENTEGANIGLGIPESYQGEDLLHKLLADGDVVLVRGSWLAQLARRQGSVLPRRQDLPPEAIWSPDGQKSEVEIAAVSYCWQTPEHPDPEGGQFRHLAQVIERYVCSRHCDIAVFIDWCSLYQLPRTPEEHASFMKSLRHVSVWYAHRQTWKWIFTARPPAGPSPAGGGGKCRSYEERGWPTFEWAASQLAGVPERVLDLGRLGGPGSSMGGKNDWAGVVEACALTSREPPRAPEAFAKILEGKVFSRPTDRAFLEAAYKRTFEDLVASAEVLDFSCLGWGDEELRQLASALPLCGSLRRLYLSWNRAGDLGAEALAAALPRCSRLCKLGLAGNPISNGGKQQFREAWSRAGRQEEQLDLW